MLEALDLIGTIVFAITGTLVASQKRLDFFGAIVIAMVTAVGGGTLRDMMLGNLPVFWIQDSRYILAILLGVLLTVLASRIGYQPKRALIYADALGLSTFCVIGTQVALANGADILISIMMGVITSVAGGMIRDILSDEIPLILRQEIYATVAFVGAVIYVLLAHMGDIAIYASVGCSLSLRILAIQRGWSFPALKAHV